MKSTSDLKVVTDFLSSPDIQAAQQAFKFLNRLVIILRRQDAFETSAICHNLAPVLRKLLQLAVDPDRQSTPFAACFAQLCHVAPVDCACLLDSKDYELYMLLVKDECNKAEASTAEFVKAVVHHCAMFEALIFTAYVKPMGTLGSYLKAVLLPPCGHSTLQYAYAIKLASLHIVPTPGFLDESERLLQHAAWRLHEVFPAVLADLHRQLPGGSAIATMCTLLH